MQDSDFYITLSIKTPTGFETIGKFFVGNNARHAEALFSKLEGTNKVDDGTMLTLELMESRGGLPFNLHILSCTLPQIGDNCKMITRETFSLLNLKPI